MSSSTPSECDCYYCHYGAEYKEFSPYCDNLASYYPTMTNPFVYYAEVPTRQPRPRERKNNCFVKAFRWYTQAHQPGDPKIEPLRIDAQTDDQSRDFQARDPREYMCQPCKDDAGFASWLDTKYQEYLRESRQDTCRDVCYQDTNQVNVTQTSIIDTNEANNTCSAHEPSTTKKFARFKSPWRRRRCPAKEDVTGKSNKSLVYLLEPKELPRPTSECCHPTSASCCSDAIEKKAQGKSQSETCVRQDREIEIYEVDVVSVQEGAETKKKPSFDKNMSDGQKHILSEKSMQCCTESTQIVNTETQCDDPNLCCRCNRNVGVNRTVKSSPQESARLSSTPTETLLSRTSKRGLSPHFTPETNVSNGQEADNCTINKDCICPLKPQYCDTDCDIKCSTSLETPPPIPVTRKKSNGNLTSQKKDHRDSLELRNLELHKANPSKVVICQCYSLETKSKKSKTSHKMESEPKSSKKRRSKTMETRQPSDIPLQPLEADAVPSQLKPSVCQTQPLPCVQQIKNEEPPCPYAQVIPRAPVRLSLSKINLHDSKGCQCSREETKYDAKSHCSIDSEISIIKPQSGDNQRVSEASPSCSQQQRPLMKPGKRRSSILKMTPHITQCLCQLEEPKPDAVPVKRTSTSKRLLIEGDSKENNREYICCPYLGDKKVEARKQYSSTGPRYCEQCVPQTAPTPPAPLQDCGQCQTLAPAVVRRESKEPRCCITCPNKGKEEVCCSTTPGIKVEVLVTNTQPSPPPPPVQPSPQTLLVTNTVQTSDHSISLDPDTMKYPFFLKIVCADKLHEDCMCQNRVYLP